MRKFAPLLILALSATACGISGGDMTTQAEPAQIAPGEPNPGAPIPVEGDNGIGGDPGDPTDVTPSVIVDGDQADVLSVCEVDPGQYRMALNAGELTIIRADDVTRGVYRFEEREFSGEVAPNESEHALNIQGSLFEQGNDTPLFFDATLGTTDLPTCEES